MIYHAAVFDACVNVFLVLYHIYMRNFLLPIAIATKLLPLVGTLA